MSMQSAAQKIMDVIERVENRCMAVDGPVTPTTKEIGEKELRTIWLACKEIAKCAKQPTDKQGGAG